jgi:hypothetical protein
VVPDEHSASIGLQDSSLIAAIPIEGRWIPHAQTGCLCRAGVLVRGSFLVMGSFLVIDFSAREK